MKVTKRTLFGTLAAAALVVTPLGCATAPMTTTQPSAPEQQAQPDRQVMAVGDNTDFSQAWSALPKSISEADAATMLVDIDPSKIVTDDTFSVQQNRRGGGGYRGGRGYGGYGGFRGGYRGFGGSRFGYRGYGGYRYYNYGGRYFPYYNYGGIYRPYYYNNYYPYLYNYNNAYYGYCNRW
ncbi:MAG: hypothetical protein ACK46X_10520 [Candidatus Sericytochromatia bacterium]